MDSDEHLESQIANLAYLENLYRDVQTRPSEIDPSWSPFFQQFKSDQTESRTVPIYSSKEERILHLFDAYRKHGHLLASINPISLEAPPATPLLDLSHLGFNPGDLDELFPTLGLLAENEVSLKQIEERLKKLYSGGHYRGKGLCMRPCRRANFPVLKQEAPFIW